MSVNTSISKDFVVCLLPSKKWGKVDITGLTLLNYSNIYNHWITMV